MVARASMATVSGSSFSEKVVGSRRPIVKSSPQPPLHHSLVPIDMNSCNDGSKRFLAKHLNDPLPWGYNIITPTTSGSVSRYGHSRPPSASTNCDRYPSGLNPNSSPFVPTQLSTHGNDAYTNFPQGGYNALDLSKGADRPAPDKTTLSTTEEVDEEDAYNSIAESLRNIELSPPMRTRGWNSDQNSTQLVYAPQLSDDSDSDDDALLSHPNKFPVEIEYHDNKHCSYRRQFNRSGEKLKQRIVNSLNPHTLQPETEVQQTKYYQKHLVRICRCGKYLQMDGALQQGRNNDCDGYEIHYSQKCRWKAYDDFKTGKRVLIRLCKCYKPV